MKPDDDFRVDYCKGMVAADVVCQWLVSMGLNVVKLDQSLTPDYRSRWSHTDEGDLKIIHEGNEGRIEVKHRPDMNFKSKEEFAYPDIIVDEKYKADGDHELPLYSYVIANKTLTHCMIIPENTRKQWKVRNIYDRKSRRYGDFYFCHLDYVMFREIK
jgi:hypothetical protein